MKEYAVFILNAIGSVAAMLVMIFITLKAFGVPLQYNEALVPLIVVGSTWVILIGVKLKQN